MSTQDLDVVVLGGGGHVGLPLSLELAECIWDKIHTDGRPFRHVSDAPFEHDVQLRVPDVRKARDVLGFEATTTLDAILDEVIPWIRAEAEVGAL